MLKPVYTSTCIKHIKADKYMKANIYVNTFISSLSEVRREWQLVNRTSSHIRVKTFKYLLGRSTTLFLHKTLYFLGQTTCNVSLKYKKNYADKFCTDLSNINYMILSNSYMYIKNGKGYFFYGYEICN